MKRVEHQEHRWVAMSFAVVMVGIAACGDESDADRGVDSNPGPVHGAASASMEESQPGGADDDAGSGEASDSTLPLVSGSIEASTRTVTRVGDVSWTVSHTRDPNGSFILFRNRGRGDGVVHVFFGEGSAVVVGPRETVTWECGKSDDPMPIAARIPSGATVYASDVECGDAVYTRPEPDQQ